MKEEFGFYIRKTVIKNLLSAHRKIAEKGSVSDVIALTKFVLKVSDKFDNILLDLGLEYRNESAECPPDKTEEYVP